MNNNQMLGLPLLVCCDVPAIMCFPCNDHLDPRVPLFCAFLGLYLACRPPPCPALAPAAGLHLLRKTDRFCWTRTMRQRCAPADLCLRFGSGPTP